MSDIGPRRPRCRSESCRARHASPLATRGDAGQFAAIYHRLLPLISPKRVMTHGTIAILLKTDFFPDAGSPSTVIAERKRVAPPIGLHGSDFGQS